MIVLSKPRSRGDSRKTHANDPLKENASQNIFHYLALTSEDKDGGEKHYHKGRQLHKSKKERAFERRFAQVKVPKKDTHPFVVWMSHQSSTRITS